MPDSEGVDATVLGKDSEPGKLLVGALERVAGVTKNVKDNLRLTNADIQVGEDHATWNPVAIVIKPITDQVTRALTNAMALDDVAPMSSMMALGNAVLVSAEAGMFTYYGVIGGSAALEKALENGLTNVAAAPPAAVLEVAKAASGMVLSMIGIAMAFGALNAYVLPMVTYFMWTFAVMGCACYAAEVVVAAPLAAFMHVRMDGAEFINQEQKTIYSLVFNAFLRPTCLLLGLIISNMIFAAMAGYVNATFGVAMIASQGNSMIGGIGILTMLGILMFMHYQLAIRSFSLIHEVPKAIAHIIGAHMDGDRGDERHGSAILTGIGNFSRTTGAQAVSQVMTPGKKKKPGEKGVPGDDDGEDGGEGGEDSGKAGGKSSPASKLPPAPPIG